MRNLLFSLIIIATSSTTHSQNRSIQFESSGTFAEILAKAKAENKLVFIDAYTTWCGPCKWMAKNMFTNDTIADYFNSNFINAKIDMEKGEGLDIAKKYDVRCYPNLLFVDGDGNLVHRSAGASQYVKDYISMGDKAKSSDDNYSAKLRRINQAAQKDPNQFAELIDLMASACLPFETYVADYYKSITPESYTNRTSWNILYNFVDDSEHPAFKYLMEHQKEYIALYGNDSVMGKIEGMYQMNANMLLYSKDFSEKKYKAYVKKIGSMKFASKDKMVFTMNLNLYLKQNNWKKAAEMAFSDNGHKFLPEAERNSICWNMYENVDDPAVLKSAAKEMQHITSSETGGTWAYYDTYAAILYKLKSKAEAEKTAITAIETAKKEGVSEAEYQSTVDLLEKIKKL
jgi:thiol-disulfide isomerase/thioredoxin